MENNVKLSQKKRIFVIPLALILSVLLIAGSSSFRFHALTDNLFRDEMTGDTLSMHYILAYPQNYGIPENTAVLPVYSRDSQTASVQELAKTIRHLETIPTVFLPKDSRLLHTLLTDYLTDEVKLQEFAYYSEPLSPSSGIQSQLPILLAEYTFRSGQDVENYLSLLEQIPACLSSIGTYEREKASAGLFMADYSADKVITQCRTIMDPDLIATERHFLDTTFSERLAALTANKVITAAEASAYHKRNHELLSEAVLPAYQSLADTISELKETGHNRQGLSYFPQGREYYTLLLSQTTGSSHSIPELKKMLAARFREDSHAFSELCKAHPDMFASDSGYSFPLTTPEEILTDLSQRMSDDFPTFPPNRKEAPCCTVKNVSESLEDYCSPAFYLTPPIDDFQSNTIYINQKDNPDGLSLYTTLAHEGYPGHLYQTVYHHLYRQAHRQNPTRNLLHYGGYIEGWGYYTEMQSYQYCRELITENNASAELSALYEASRLNRSMQLCLFSLLDIAIHYDGADPEQVSRTLEDMGITDKTIVQNIYEYIVEEPATYPKYYIGYLEILALKEQAKASWGEGFSELRFHQALLDAGPMPFDLLEKCILSEK